MHNMPLVSICVPTYNAAPTVKETLLSILAQTYSNLVVHVSDNASTDDTVQIIESISDPRISIHRHDKNIGAEGNFNQCIRLAEGKYTAIFHADDIYEPDMVKRQVDFLEAHSTAAAVFTEASLIDETGRRFGTRKLPPVISPKIDLYDFSKLFKAVLHHHNFFICPSAMIKTRVLQTEIKQWHGELFKSSADLDVWLRISQLHPVGFLHLPLMRYRISKFQFSAQVRQQCERADFFLVTDYFLANEEVRRLLNETDMMHYQWLERTDLIRRALSLFALDRVEEANRLIGDLLTLDLIRAALSNKRSLLTLLAGAYMKLIAQLRLHRIGKILLGYVRR